MALTLYHSPGTRSIRILWLLEELGLPYKLVRKKYDSAYFASDEFLAINPMGKVPALFDDDQLLIESTAIMEYLLQRSESTMLRVAPNESQYALYLQWLHMAESGMANYIAVSFGQTFDKAPYQVSTEFDRYCRFQVAKALTLLETQLGENEYLLDKGFTAADVSLGYTLFFAQFCIGVQLSDRVKGYYDRITARPAAQVAFSDLT